MHFPGPQLALVSVPECRCTPRRKKLRYKNSVRAPKPDHRVERQMSERTADYLETETGVQAHLPIHPWILDALATLESACDRRFLLEPVLQESVLQEPVL